VRGSRMPSFTAVPGADALREAVRLWEGPGRAAW
jgi:hypothetical protein